MPYYLTVPGVVTSSFFINCMLCLAWEWYFLLNNELLLDSNVFDQFFFGFICSTLEISERLRRLECLLASETFCKWPNEQILMVAHSYTPCPLNVNIDSRHLIDMSWDPACRAPSLSLCMSLCLHDSLPPPLYFGQCPSLLLWPLQKSLLRYLSFSMVSLLPHGRELGSVFTLSGLVQCFPENEHM